ncbi:DUF3231 family protein [Bacillus sp. ISL-47]|uniref:DUF3231 family protein n=1 Tax=Bacillus sp. ISL-47 TaxID=2819130 RepID=UPI001BEBCD21|nr:DUF3231 family protein [Bacillus sp. ISL-47]MBT2687729.1 DUF3231 family protein [Bacillus sp. ISL-47]
MFKLKPIKIHAEKLDESQKLTSAEMGKLWATYMGNSMSSLILRYFLQHVEDKEIKLLLQNGLHLSETFMKTIKVFFEKDNFPIPLGFTDDDVNLNAPRLFEDEFYVHYIKYAAKAGLSLYAVAIPLVMRDDIMAFFSDCSKSTSELLVQVNHVLIEKGFLIKPPIIPVPESIKFVEKHNYFKGFVGDIRPLHALEITHLFDNVENNATSKGLLIGFINVAKDEKVREFLQRGLDITNTAATQFRDKLHKGNLPSPGILDHLVTSSSFPPFSDKLMLFHKVDMFSMKVRSFANSAAVNGRRDLALLYARAMMRVSIFAEDGANMMIEKGWMEQPPHARD